MANRKTSQLRKNHKCHKLLQFPQCNNLLKVLLMEGDYMVEKNAFLFKKKRKKKDLGNLEYLRCDVSRS